MTVSLKSAVVTIALGLAAGVAGMWIGHQFFSAPNPHNTSLHDMVHKELTLTPSQERAIDAEEKAFAVRRKELEDEIRKANAELAEAILASETAGPEVAAAVHHFHDAMGILQSETIEHVFAMRGVLTPEQRTTFDARIKQALTADGQ